MYIIQPAGENVNDNLMELLIAISACKTASARKASILRNIELRDFSLTFEKVTAVLPVQIQAPKMSIRSCH